MSIICRRLPEEPAYIDVLACQFSSWYPTFSNVMTTSSEQYSDSAETHKWNDSRKSVTIKSVIIKEISPDFISYMLSDGVQLPVGASKVSSFLPQDSDENDTWSSDSDQEDYQGPSDDQSDSIENNFELSELTDQIIEGISSLGGSAFPKLNWSAPRDSAWINNGSLQCKTPGDVYLLIKSSDFCLHDILFGSDALDVPSDKSNNAIAHELILRRWCNLWPSMEFRCFVANYNISTFQISLRPYISNVFFQSNSFASTSCHVSEKSSSVLRTFGEGSIKNTVNDSRFFRRCCKK